MDVITYPLKLIQVSKGGHNSYFDQIQYRTAVDSMLHVLNSVTPVNSHPTHHPHPTTPHPHRHRHPQKSSHNFYSMLAKLISARKQSPQGPRLLTWMN